MIKPEGITRRKFIKTTAKGIFLAGLHFALPLPAWASPVSTGIKGTGPENRYDLTIGYSPVRIDGRKAVSTGVNGSVPGPLVRLREGEDVALNVTNRLMDTKHASIHWHGVLVPFSMDGVPGVNFKGIPPEETYEYRYRVKQAGQHGTVHVLI